MRTRSLITAVLVRAALVPAAFAAPTEQRFGYSPDSFEIKYFLQPRYSYMLAGDNADENTFRLRRARLILTSNVAPAIRGRLQVNASPDRIELLDAFLEWTPWAAAHPAFSFTFGQFKKPFSYAEYVMPAADLWLIDKPTTHDVLEKKLFASAYDQGLMATADLWEYDLPLLVHLGVFNGNGGAARVDANHGKQIVGRLEAVPVAGLTVGGNAALNRLDAFEAEAGDTTRSGRFYSVWGGDVLFQRGRLQLLGEVIGGDNYEPVATAAGARKMPGFDAPTFLTLYAEAIYRTAGGWEPAARVEKADPDIDTGDDGRLVLTGQIARAFSPNFRWQINLVHTEFETKGKEADDEIVGQWTVKL